MNKYSVARSREVKQARAGLQKLDLLFLSHIHDDHVNGVPQLLNGLSVDTIVMPLMGVVERLLVFALSVSNGASSSGLHADLAADPTTAVEQFNPRQILYLKRTDDGRDDGAPIEDAPTHDGPTGPDGQMSWKLIGKGTVTAGKPEDGSGDASPLDAHTFTIDDINALAVTTAGRRRWLLAPYVQPSAVNEAEFIKCLASELSRTESYLRKALQSISFRRALITKHVNSLKAAFELASSNLNFTSLSLYSGPLPEMNTVPTVHPGRYDLAACGAILSTRLDSRRAWLGTGDADLLRKARLGDFLEHYRGLLHEVGTLTVPHHGSDRNSASPLYERAKPRVCVSAADAYSNWRHPASSVIQAIASAGAASIVVTASTAARFKEVCILPH